ncbi:MAG: helix-turn-helix domain-containing protein [Lachnospiraceae bacterium]|nr:helix-turn-helix domain-containing protein [Lachnospiraceae bacterium]
MDSKKTGKTIAYLRKQKNYTQKELAQLINISDKAVSKWERGLGFPDVSTLPKLSIILGADIESILTGNISSYRKSWVGILLLDKGNDNIYAGSYIYDKPLVYFLLSYYMLVGIKKILIFSNDDSRQFIENCIGTGEQYGIQIAVENSSSYPTFMEKIERIRLFAGKQHTAIMNGYNFIYGIDLTKYMQRAMSRSNAAGIIAIMQQSDSDCDPISYDADVRLLSVHQNAVDRRNLYYETPLVFVDNAVLNSVQTELSNFRDLIKYLIGKGLLYAELVGRGMIFEAVDNYDKILLLSQLTKIIEELQDIKIADIYEIAVRRGLISMDRQ